MNKLLKDLSFFAAFSLLVAFGFLGFDYFQGRQKFPFKTFIGKIEVSCLTQEEAQKKLSSLRTSEIFSPLVTFEAGKIRFTFSPEAVGIIVDPENSVRQAFALSHEEGNYLKELMERLKKEARIIPPILKVDEAQLKAVVESIAEEIRSTPQDASFIFYEETGGYHIEPEEIGKELKIQETLQACKKEIAEGRATYSLIIKYTYPLITEKELRAYPPVYRLSAYTTYYGRHDSPNRIHNIKLMASWINNTLLMPGEEFSLVKAIGEFTPERGFKEAFVIYEGVLTPMLGGGGCQIGTTLYNAAALADLEILQRRNHSFYFNIYPLGRDATIYPGQVDLKFKNNTGHPIFIKALATNKRLSFRIYGTPTGKKVEFSPPSVYMLTPSGFRPASVREVLAADAPFKTYVTRTVYDAEGNKIKEETITSFYKLYGEKTNVPIARPEPR